MSLCQNFFANCLSVVAILSLVAICGCDEAPERAETTTTTEPDNSTPATTTDPSSPSPPSQADPQAELKKRITALRAQYNKPPNSPPAYTGVPFDSQTGYLTNDQGEIIDADLSYTPTTDDDLKSLSSVASLEVLGLTGTKITNLGMVHVPNFKNLKRLSLYMTGVSDDSIPFLSKVTSLTSLGVNTTNITEEGMEKLRQALPGCDVR